MAYYANQKDAFTTDSGLWTVSTTNGSSAISAGTRTFDKTSDAWSETGMVRAVRRVPNKGDIAFCTVTLTEATTTNTYQIAAFANSGTLGNVSLLGPYFYPDGGQHRAHGQASGSGTEHNPAINLSPGDQFNLLWFYDGTTGYGDVKAIGGPFSVLTALVTGTADLTTVATDLAFVINIYSTDSGMSITRYGWCDSAGPTPNIPTSPTAVASGKTTVDLSWANDEVADFWTGHKIERSTVGGGVGFSEIADITNIATTTYADSGLDAGTTYYYRFRSYFTLAGTTYYSSYTSESNAETDAAFSGVSGALMQIKQGRF